MFSNNLKRIMQSRKMQHSNQINQRADKLSATTTLRPSKIGGGGGGAHKFSAARPGQRSALVVHSSFVTTMY